jgi:hypothetical protein
MLPVLPTLGLQPFRWQDAVEYVYTEFLSRPYPDDSIQDDTSHVTVPRSDHRLLPALRTASYVPLVVKIYNLFVKTTLDQHDIDRMQLALLFYDAGRRKEVLPLQPEDGESRRISAEAFVQYVRSTPQVAEEFSEAQLEFYRNGVRDPFSEQNHHYTIIQICQDLDLLRCYAREGYQEKLDQAANYLGPHAQALGQLAEACIRETGDRITPTGARSEDLFIRCSQSVVEAIRRLEGVFQSDLVRNIQLGIDTLTRHASPLAAPALAILPPRVPAFAFGAEKWRKYFGEVGEEPPLPHDIEAILDAPCQYFKGRRVRDTQLLFLDPFAVDGVEPEIQFLDKLVQYPKAGGHRTRLRICNLGAYRDTENRAKKSRWVLMTREIVPDSLGHPSGIPRCALKKSPLTKKYDVPTLRVATMGIFLEYVSTGNRICTDVYSECKEIHSYPYIEENRYIGVGGFNEDGLEISDCNFYFRNRYVGAFAMRELVAEEG